MTASQSLTAILRRLTYQGIAKNTVYQLVGKVFTALSTLVVVRLTSQYYGPSGVGDLSLILNYLNIFYLIADFGLNAIVVKRMVEKPEEEQLLFKALYGLRLVSGVTLAFLAILIAFMLPFNPETNTGFSSAFKGGILLLGATILTQGIYLTATTVFQKRLSYGATAFAIAAGSVITMFVYVLFARPDISLLLPLVGFLTGGFLAALIAVSLLPFPYHSKYLPRVDLHIWKSIVLQSLPIAATLLLNVVYFKSDSFVLASLMPRDDVGIYGVAYKIFDQGIVVPVFFVNALYPILLQQVTYAKEKLVRTLQTTAVLLFLGGIVLGLFEIITAPLLVAIVANGENFSDSILPLRILALGLPFFFVSNLFLWLLVTLGKQKYLIFIYGASMIFNVVVNIILIPRYSYIASAILTGVSEAIVLALTMGFGLYFLNIKLKEARSS